MKKSCIKSFLLCVVLLGMAFTGWSSENPYFKLQSALRNIRDNFNSFEDVEKKLNDISPSPCQVDKISISQAEMEFLVTVFKLDFAVTLKKGEKALGYAKKLEKITAENKIDYKKLSPLFDNIDFEFIVELDISQAYIITNNPEKVLDILQGMLPKHKEGSYEYAMTRFTLGLAFFKIDKAQMAIEPLKYGLDYFVKVKNKPYAAIAASNLAAAYLMLGDKKNHAYYLDLSAKYVGDNSAMVECEIAINKLLNLLFSHIESDFMPSDIKKEFEKNCQIVLTKSNSDLQLWAVYVSSAMWKTTHKYSAEECLNDLEKAYMYRGMIWGDGQANETVKVIDEGLALCQKALFELLAETKQLERLNYWNARFARSKQRKTELSAIADNKRLLPLLTLVSRYENIRQILIMEESKPQNQRNKKLILSAAKQKKEIEKFFETVEEQLNEDEHKKFKNALNDRFIIPPDSLKQLSDVLPADTACLQYLPAGDSIIIYITGNGSAPFPVHIKLKDKDLTEKLFNSKLVRFYTMLQSNVPERRLKKEANDLYKLIFAELEPALAKLKVNRLVINAAGLLRYLPFAALYDGKRYLVEKYQITGITGMDLVRLSKNLSVKKISSMETVIFADPDGNLPASQQEWKCIAGLFKQNQCFVGKEATLDNFKTLLGNINLIHLATHAVLDSEHPELSYIKFANNQKWQYKDMMSFNIKDIDSIVLSACSTAVKPSSNGSEIESMAYQLLRKSPSGSIVASFWDVDDGATAAFMQEYYQHIVNSIKKNGTLDRGGALRKAQLKLLKNRETASPKYWAAFTLFGDFR